MVAQAVFKAHSLLLILSLQHSIEAICSHPVDVDFVGVEERALFLAQRLKIDFLADLLIAGLSLEESQRRLRIRVHILIFSDWQLIGRLHQSKRVLVREQGGLGL